MEQDDQLNQFYKVKMGALLHGIVMRLKGGEDQWADVSCDPQLHYPKREIVYELCPSGDLVLHT